MHIPAKNKKDLFCRSGKRASRKDSTKRKLFPKKRKTKLKENDQGSYSQTEHWLEEFDVGVQVGASAKKISRIRNFVKLHTHIR